jgi:hypothetical protein
MAARFIEIERPSGWRICQWVPNPSGTTESVVLVEPKQPRTDPTCRTDAPVPLDLLPTGIRPSWADVPQSGADPCCSPDSPLGVWI